MKVSCYTLTTAPCDGGPAPRAWRIATQDGVFWLVKAGADARLVRLPRPGGHTGDRPRPDGDLWTALEALASTAEAVAADRWVRSGQAARRPAGIAGDIPWHC
jgi:hypothetical protein